MRKHRNPQASVSKQVPSDNFNPGDAIELLYSELVEARGPSVPGAGARRKSMLANDETELRSFCARILGWPTEREVVVEHAVRSIELAVDQSAARFLIGGRDDA